MEISLNGQKIQLAAPLSLHELLAERDWLGKRLAVELNGAIVPKSAYATTALQPGDQLEVVVAVGGG